MCEQCNANPVAFGQPIPGWTLMRARRDGNEWKKGEWALIRSNDPDFTWTTTPTPSPLFGIEDEADQEAWFALHPDGTPEHERVFADLPKDFEDAFTVEPGTGYDLVVAAMQKGYDPATSGDFNMWFFDLLGEHLKDAPMTEVNHDAFPEREANFPSDLTIGRD